MSLINQFLDGKYVKASYEYRNYDIQKNENGGRGHPFRIQEFLLLAYDQGAVLLYSKLFYNYVFHPQLFYTLHADG